MNVKTYQNFSKRTNETKVPTSGGTDVNVELKQATSIMSPTLILSGFDPSMNYIDIPGWSRKYFVNDYRKGNNDLFEVSCEEDIAGTWKSHIGNYTCYIERCSSSNHYNVDMPDNMISVEDVVQSATTATTTLFGTTGGTYILRLIGRGDAGVATYVFATSSEIGGLFNPIFNSYYDNNDFSNLEIGDFIQAFLCDPDKYVLGAYYSPLPSSAYTGKGVSEVVPMGFFKTSQVGYRLTVATKSDLLPLNKPSSAYNDFRKTDDAFSQYTMYLPGVGSVQLSPDIMADNLSIQYTVDLMTGEIFYTLYSSQAGVIATYSGCIYASLQLGRGDASGGGRIISALANTGANLALGNVVGATAGGIEVLRSGICPTPSVNGTQSGMASIKSAPNITISLLQKASGAIAVNNVGRPCCKNLQIGNLSGYVKCGNASIDIPGTKAEKDAVNALLNGGFYYT